MALPQFSVTYTLNMIQLHMPSGSVITFESLSEYDFGVLLSTILNNEAATKAAFQSGWKAANAIMASSGEAAIINFTTVPQ